MRTATVEAPTAAQQLAAERVLRHGAHHARTGAYLNRGDLAALVALLDRLRAERDATAHLKTGA